MVQLLRSLSLLCGITLVSAQYGNSGNAPSSSQTTSAPASTASVKGVHTVAVGKSGLSYEPNSLNVAPGEKVEFHFYPGPHEVVAATFDNPCHPDMQNPIFSGSVPGSSGGGSMVFTVTVNDTKPIWFYCGVIGHCQGGMVGVINPPSSGPNTLDAFKSAASDTKDSSAPASVAGGVWGTASSATKTTGSASSSTPTGEGQSLRVWSSMSAVMVLSAVAAVCLM